MNNPGENIVGILGSGFGLYGYLPAVALNGNNTIVLLEKDKHKFEARPELQDFKENIRWIDERCFYEQINTLIVCLSPEGQFSSVTRALTYPNIRHLLLEKPLAINPNRSHELLDVLIKSKKNYRIGYNFQYTNWGQTLLNTLNNRTPCMVKIDWSFFAHHFAKNLKNWKRYNSTGGSVIRFYGIHLIALLAHMKSCEILSSSATGHEADEMYKWSAKFQVNLIHTIEIELNSAASVNKFNLSVRDQNSKNKRQMQVSQNDPFDESISIIANQDRRVSVVKSVLDLLKESDKQYYWNNIYKNVNHLWEQIENVNICTI